MVLVTFSLLTLMGCSTYKDQTSHDFNTAATMASGMNVPEKLKPYYQRLYMEGESKATLNRMRLASAAIDLGEWKHAGEVLDQVLPTIEGLGPANPKSREALLKFKPEMVKNFKGEPYERAMAWFLRGLLYMKEEDWDNARACFKSVQLQDTMDANPDQRSNWASADWLEGWCNRKLGQNDAAEKSWERARKHSNGALDAPGDKDAILCVALLGCGPVKLPRGAHGAQLMYEKGMVNVSSAILRSGEQKYATCQAEDLFLQASARGKRTMDKINEGKADTKTGVNTAGDVLIVGGLVTAVAGAEKKDEDVAMAGLAAAGAGLMAKALASGIQPQADTRSWDLLPAYIHIVSLPMDPKMQNLQGDLLDRSGRTVRTFVIPLKTISPSNVLILNER